MSHGTSPEQAPSTRPVFEVYTEPNPIGWASNPEDFGIMTAITPEYLERSNLLRNLRSAPTRAKNEKGVTAIIPPTSRSEIISEVLKLTVPKNLSEVVADMSADAQAAESQYDESYVMPDAEYDDQEVPDIWLADDRSYQDFLDSQIENCRDSLVVQGINSFIELEYDFHGGIHMRLLHDTRRFAVHLILASQ